GGEVEELLACLNPGPCLFRELHVSFELGGPGVAEEPRHCCLECEAPALGAEEPRRLRSGPRRLKRRTDGARQRMAVEEPLGRVVGVRRREAARVAADG